MNVNNHQQNLLPMKKALILLMTVTLVCSCSLVSKKPVEKLISKQNIEMTGNGFEIFRLGADMKLVTVQNPDDADEWMIRGSVPLMKISEDQLTETEIVLNLLDESGMKVRDGYLLVAEDLVNLIPKYNAEKNLEKTIVFTTGEDSRKYFSYKEACDILERTKQIAMNVNVVKAEPEVAVTPTPEKKKDGPVTFQSLMEKYGVYGKLSQYDKALSQKEKKKAKQIEDDLFKICKQVKNDPTVPQSVAQKFRDYIEDKEDEIEKKY